MGAALFDSPWNFPKSFKGFCSNIMSLYVNDFLLLKSTLSIILFHMSMKNTHIYLHIFFIYLHICVKSYLYKNLTVKSFQRCFLL